MLLIQYEYAAFWVGTGILLSLSAEIYKAICAKYGSAALALLTDVSGERGRESAKNNQNCHSHVPKRGHSSTECSTWQTIVRCTIKAEQEFSFYSTILVQL